MAIRLRKGTELLGEGDKGKLASKKKKTKAEKTDVRRALRGIKDKETWTILEDQISG